MATKRKIIKTLKHFLYAFLILIFLSVISTTALFAYYAKDLPGPENFSKIKIAQSTKIFDRTGQILLYEIHGEEKRTVVKFDEIPKYAKLATIAVEDSDFYNHSGIRIKAILRAFILNLKKNKNYTQGGSTITQQLIKRSFLTPEKTLGRKIKEAILSIELEQKYSKDKILELYLNQISYGSNAYGIEAASQTFFNKHVWELSLAESAILAALPQAPTYYSPYGNRKEDLKNRQEYVLNRMEKLGYINKIETEEAKKENIIFSNTKTGIKAPHFVMYVKEIISEKYGEEYIEQSGLNIYTTLDWELQKEAEKIVYEEALSNEKKYNSKNAALTAVNPQTGEILAMVGSRDYFDQKIDGNVNIATSLRQPGSAFKPFAYAAAFQKGFTPNTVLFDLETEFNPDCVISELNPTPKNDETCYHPQNYSGKFKGPVTLRESLAQSLNIPSVKTLYLAGIDNTLNLAENMGISTLKNRSRFGLSLVLGAGEVKLLEITSAYGTFAADGQKNQLSGILLIKNQKGEILEKYAPEKQNILDAQIARQINSVLSDNKARAPVFGEQNYLYLPNRQVAAKTGTTQNYYDAWVVGYTPSISVGVWVGNNRNDNSIDKSGAGISAAGPIWRKFIEFALKDKPAEEFIPPENKYTGKSILDGNWHNEKIVEIDKISGLLATSLTPPELIERKNVKEAHTILYFIDKNNPLGNPSINPKNDPQFFGWENAIINWLEATGKKNEFESQYQIPIDYDNIHIPENIPKIQILKPEQNQTITPGQKISVDVFIDSKYKIREVYYLLDDYILMTKNEPLSYAANLTIPQSATFGNHTLKIRVFDEVGNKNEEEIIIFLES